MIKEGHFALFFLRFFVFVLLIQRHKGKINQLSDFPGIKSAFTALVIATTAPAVAIIVAVAFMITSAFGVFSTSATITLSAAAFFLIQPACAGCEFIQ
jgi:hypothetical protein